MAPDRIAQTDPSGPSGPRDPNASIKAIGAARTGQDLLARGDGDPLIPGGPAGQEDGGPRDPEETADHNARSGREGRLGHARKIAAMNGVLRETDRDDDELTSYMDVTLSVRR